jgi:alkanesulfonate monooxygenase SsuD/methylene tetrahydromethanopterin reductase-like flavin-dependent oxidoreductase (luciferase family)
MPTVVGSAEDIADQLEEFFVDGGGDGFNVSVPATPYDYVRFVDEVVPLLQKRGLVRDGFDEGPLFRDKMSS